MGLKPATSDFESTHTTNKPHGVMGHTMRKGLRGQNFKIDFHC